MFFPFNKNEDKIDYDDEGIKLIKSLTGKDSITKTSYNDLDMIYKDSKTGGCIYVGNQTAAQSESLLNTHSISHVVNWYFNF